MLLNCPFSPQMNLLLVDLKMYVWKSSKWTAIWNLYFAVYFGVCLCVLLVCHLMHVVVCALGLPCTSRKIVPSLQSFLAAI